MGQVLAALPRGASADGTPRQANAGLAGTAGTSGCGNPKRLELSGTRRRKHLLPVALVSLFSLLRLGDLARPSPAFRPVVFPMNRLNVHDGVVQAFGRDALAIGVDDQWLDRIARPAGLRARRRLGSEVHAPKHRDVRPDAPVGQHFGEADVLHQGRHARVARSRRRRRRFRETSRAHAGRLPPWRARRGRPRWGTRRTCRATLSTLEVETLGSAGPRTSRGLQAVESAGPSAHRG